MLENLGKYEIRLQLGRGGMGVVYEGFDPIIGRRVAIKTLRTENIDPEDLPEFLVRFKREAQSAGRLSHPHIITIHEYGEQDNMPYIVMEYVQGHDLGVDLKRGVRFRVDEIVRIMSQLLGALTHAHEAGVVHRDIKPQNILLLGDGSLKVVDFGIARIEESESFTKTGAMIGTPAYMSPEQVLGLHVTAKSDIFSAGTLLYQLLTGDRPFTGDEYSVKQKVLKQDPMPPSELNPTLGSPWDAVVARAMAKKPEARYETARQFLEAIRAAGEAESRAAENERLKRIEVEEHANREAAARSREEFLRREQAERQAAISEARVAREETERAKHKVTDTELSKDSSTAFSTEPTLAAVTARNRAVLIAAGILFAIIAVGAFKYGRIGADEEARKIDTARIASETKLREESERRVKAEALAREESDRRSRLEAEAARREIDAKAQADRLAKIRTDEDEKRIGEEKAKVLIQKKTDEEKRKRELAVTVELEARARIEAEAKLKAEEAERIRNAERARAEELEKVRNAERLKAEAQKVMPDVDSKTPPARSVEVANSGTLRKILDSRSITIGHREASLPFSYYNERQQPIGYSIDLCNRIVDAVKAKLRLSTIEVKYQLVTAANRFSLVANGSVDLECGSTTNNVARQEQVGFSITHFVSANRWIAKKSSNLKSLADIRGKTVVSTAGTNNARQITEINVAQSLGMNVILANGHVEAFQMVESGRAAAFVMDDILLAGLAAQSRAPHEYEISADALSMEPYAIVLRKDDKAFKAIADRAILATYRSGQIHAIYEKWFQRPVPPRGINLNFPISQSLAKTIAKPTDSGDPRSYF